MLQSFFVDRGECRGGSDQHLQNPPVRAALRAGLPLGIFALVETKGRKTGQRRQTPVINGLHGEEFWIVAEHGRNAHYVRNLETEPRVRIKAGGQWRAGTAHILEDDDPYARARWMSKTLGPLHRADLLVTRVTATTPLTIRVVLDNVSTPRE